MVALAGCGTLRPSPTPTPAAAIDPTLGGLHISTDPAEVSEPLRIEYVSSVANLEGMVDLVVPGAPVSVSRVLPPGAVQVVVDGVACGEPVDIVANVELDIQLELDGLGGPCRPFIEITHALGKVGHPIRGALMSAVVPQGATVVFRQLDQFDAPAIEVVAGPTGVEAMEFVPGRYEVTATKAGELLIRTEVDLVRTPDIVLDLMVLARSVPRDCNGIDLVTCEAAISAAMSYGTWITPRETVTAVRLRETDVMSCDPRIRPELDVVFRLAPPGEISVTVGRLDDDRWRACPAY